MNKQKDIPESISLSRQPEGKIPVMEAFYSLQGEGAWAGTAAYFIRLAGCDVGCFWCDVKESWEVSKDQWKNIDNVVQEALDSGTEMVVLTGGEPTMWDLKSFIEALQTKGLRVHMETAGVYSLTGMPDWVCLSPKKFKAALPEFFELAHELKVIVSNRHDLAWAKEQAAKCDPEITQFLMQPEWTKHKEAEKWIIDFIKANPKWRMSLQTHKYLDIR